MTVAMYVAIVLLLVQIAFGAAAIHDYCRSRHASYPRAPYLRDRANLLTTVSHMFGLANVLLALLSMR